MSRKKIKIEEQKWTITIRIPNELYANLEGVKNKSKFVEWLLVEYFDEIKKGY